MRTNIILTVCVLGNLAGAVSGVAQVYPYGGWPYPAPSHVEVFHHASTVAESYLTGQARLARAAGERNYWNSVATLNYMQAQFQYEQMRERKFAAGAARQEAKNKRRTTQRKSAIAKGDEYRREMVQAAIELQQSLNENGGHIEWPVTVRKPELVAQLSLIENSAARIARGDSLDWHELGQVKKAVRDFKGRVHRNRVALGNERTEAMLQLLRTIETLTSRTNSADYTTAANG